MHEPELDGWRCIAQVQDGKVRLWTRGGLEWSPLLPELSCLADLGDLVLDGELVALSPDGRPDLDLLSTHMTGRPPTCRSACTSSTSSAWVSTNWCKRPGRSPGGPGRPNPRRDGWPGPDYDALATTAALISSREVARRIMSTAAASRPQRKEWRCITKR